MVRLGKPIGRGGIGVVSLMAVIESDKAVDLERWYLGSWEKLDSL